MKRLFLGMILTGLVFSIACGATFGTNGTGKGLAVQLADSVLLRWPDPTMIDAKNNGWEYTTGIVLVGMEKVYDKTKDPRYLTYIKKWVDEYVDAKGNIRFKAEDRNQDRIQPGQLLLFLYRETGAEKYQKAAAMLRGEVNMLPRNAVGGFWHKKRYPNEMWLDGIYMTEPFLVRYGKMFNDAESCNKEAMFQASLIAAHTQDPKTGLLYHGWDAGGKTPWGDPVTHHSSQFWCRGMGWYMTALVEVLPYLPKDDPQYAALLKVFQKAAAGLKQMQDPATGLWYQVLDRGSAPDNWLETSGSGLFVYALKSGVDRGYLDAGYLDVARKGWEGLQTRISYTNPKLPDIKGTVQGMGVQVSYQDYVNKEIQTNLPHAFCGMLFAASVMGF